MGAGEGFLASLPGIRGSPIPVTRGQAMAIHACPFSLSSQGHYVGSRVSCQASVDGVYRTWELVGGFESGSFTQAWTLSAPRDFFPSRSG